MCFNRPWCLVAPPQPLCSSILSSSCSPSPALLILSTHLRCLHEATQRHRGDLSRPVAFPVGLGSQAPAVQEGDKNRRAPRRRYSQTGSSGLLGRGGCCSRKKPGWCGFTGAAGASSQGCTQGLSKWKSFVVLLICLPSAESLEGLGKSRAIPAHCRCLSLCHCHLSWAPLSLQRTIHRKLSPGSQQALAPVQTVPAQSTQQGEGWEPSRDGKDTAGSAEISPSKHIHKIWLFS